MNDLNQWEFECPYCGEVNFLEIDMTGGKSQSFTVDCEVCCSPIDVNVNTDRDGNITIDAKNDEGF